MQAVKLPPINRAQMRHGAQEIVGGTLTYPSLVAGGQPFELTLGGLDENFKAISCWLTGGPEVIVKTLSVNRLDAETVRLVGSHDGNQPINIAVMYVACYQA